MKKEKVLQLIEKDIPFIPNYSVIKEKIDSNQYIFDNVKNRRKVFKLKYISAFSAFIIVLLGGLFMINNPKIINKDYNKNIISYPNDYEFIEDYDYVFVSQVTKEIETKQYDGTGTEIPYTFYEYEIIELLKGTRKENSLLCVYGGVIDHVFWTEHFNIGDLPEVGKFYIFFANNTNNQSTNKRVGENDMIIAHNYQMILLEDYVSEKTLYEQNEKTLQVINRYQNIVNKKLGNEELDIKVTNDKKELKNMFEYVAIVSVKNDAINNLNLEGTGVNSSIVASKYNLSSIQILQGDKEKIKSNTLYCYGTKFWEDEVFEHYVNVLEEEKVYLLFADICTNNSDNTRVDEGSFVVMDNCQLVEIDEYNKLLSLDKQDQKVIDFIKEYIDSWN